MDLSLSTTPKLQKPYVKEKEDRISKLPDEILSHILYFLPEKCAQKTRVLSTRWNYLWALLPSLDFVMPRRNCSSTCRCEVNRFLDFADRTLILRNGMPFQRFHLCCTQDCDYDRVYALICTVINCNVQELDLRIFGFRRKVKKLPWDLLTACKTLVVLKLGSNFVLEVPDHVYFPSLKTLNLTLLYNNLDDASTQRLISGCPVLEDLTVERPKMDNIRAFYVSVPSLKRLSLVFESTHEFVTDYKVVVDTPNLEYLKLFDQLTEEYTIGSLSSLVEANLHVEHTRRSPLNRVHGERVFGLLKSISAVKTLALSGCTMRALGYAHINNLPTFHNLDSLTLGLDEDHGWLLLPVFFESMPNLEVLVFENRLIPAYYTKGDDWFGFNFYPPQHVPACLLLNLKTIEIHGLVAVMKEELELIYYLLKNAKVLKTMTIPNVDPDIQKKLLKFPRGSTSVQLNFT